MTKRNIEVTPGEHLIFGAVWEENDRWFGRWFVGSRTGLIFGAVWEENDRWFGRWFVGSRTGTADFDSEEEAKDCIKRNVNREAGFE